MEKPEILSFQKLAGAYDAGLDAHFIVHRAFDAPFPIDSAPEGARRAVGLITLGGRHGASAAFIDSMPNLEIIATHSVGYDKVDVAHAKRKGIVVANTPDVPTDDVADMGVALMLASSRGILRGDAYVRRGAWANGMMGLTHAVHGKTVGIVGLGRIGRTLARRCEAFDMDIRYFDATRFEDVAYPFYTDLTAMARDVDFLILTCIGGQSTYHLVDKKVMEALGPTGTLINVSRGTVVVNEDLVETLEAGSLGFAALDVFEGEPAVPEALMAMDNVVLSPHHASGTFDAREAMSKLVTENLVAFFSGRPVLKPVPEMD